MTDADERRTWEKGWDGHQVDQLRRLARLSLSEKLQWLDEAARLVEHLARAAPKTVKNDSTRRNVR